MSFLISPRRKQYSIDRLRVVYTDLLQHIDVAKEDLGRCGIDDDDADFHKKSMRFSFRRKVLPRNTPESTSTSSLENESRDEPNAVSSGKDNRELVAAFRMLAATRSPDKEGDNFGAAANRDDASVTAMSAAKAIEERVVELVRTIGEIIVNAEQQPPQQQQQQPINKDRGMNAPQVRSDPVFEYFCEKNILSLLVDIAKEVRQGSEVRLSDSLFHGVVWSPMVKAQVLQTVSLLISDERNQSILYYLLSHNYINDLIQCMLPLKQWTDQALVKMMPSFVELLKTVTVQLADDPHLFPFLTVEDQQTSKNNNNNPSTTLFPLFTASMEVATSTFALSDSLIYGTSLAVTVNIMQISYFPIQDWVTNAGSEQRRLADHLCQRLLDRYYRIASLTTGPVVDGVRSNAIAGQLAGLRDHLGMIREVFWSGVRGLDVRLCEALLQRVVNVLLKSLLPGTTNRPFLAGVGEIDIDVIPDSEAMAQVSTIFLSQMYTSLAYVPLQRMLSVALLHPRSTPLWSTTQSTKQTHHSEETYVFMPALSDIVNGKESAATVSNPYREEVLKSLGGEYGEWRVLASSCLMHSILTAENTDSESLDVLNIIPKFDDTLDYEPTALEHAVATYLEREHRRCRVSSRSLESVGMLSIYMVRRTVANLSRKKSNVDIQQRLSQTVISKSLVKALDTFNGEARKCLQATGISNIFLDLVEAEITNRYTARGTNSSEATTFTCSLASRSSVDDSEMLVRKFRDVSSNDVETARFCIRMALQYRALCKVVDRHCSDVERAMKSEGGTGGKTIDLELLDKADGLISTIGGLKDAPTLGTDLDLTGRMTFPCRSAPRRLEPLSPKGSPEKEGNSRVLANNIPIFNRNPRLMLVLDPTDMNVVKPAAGQMEENRGTILCSISLRSVIAAAADNEWLHVAVRHEDVTSLIKNGNAALKFENAGTCLVVKQYLDRSREVLRQELLEKVSILLKESSKPAIIVDNNPGVNGAAV